MYLAMPIMHKLLPGTALYDQPLDLFADMNEILMVQAENERRYSKYLESK